MKTARIGSDFGLDFQNQNKPNRTAYIYFNIYISIFISIIYYIKLLFIFFLILLILHMSLI